MYRLCEVNGYLIYFCALYRRCTLALNYDCSLTGELLLTSVGDNQKRCTPVFTAFMVRGFVPHARQSCAGVEETGHLH